MQGQKDKDSPRATSPSWNWTEKIVGKGAGKRRRGSKGPQSPVSPEPENEGGDATEQRDAQ